jgi:pyruvate,water dikinase
MAEEKAGGFPDPFTVAVPSELDGWEEMYPSHYLFSEDRKEWEDRQFWYHDKIHAAEPLTPLDHIFQEAWQIALSQYTTRVFCIPPAQGVAHRMVGGYMYISAVDPPPDEIVEAKAKLFEKRVFYVFDHYDELWEQWLNEFQALGKEMNEVVVPEELPQFVSEDQVIPLPRGYYISYDLGEAFGRLVNLMLKGWQYHFEMLNLSYLAYLMFADVTRNLFPGISESIIGKMVAGANVTMFRPEEQLCRLSRSATSLRGVADILKSGDPVEQKIRELKKTSDGRHWLEEFEEAKDPWFFVSCGSGWLHNEGSWINKLHVPFGYIQSYVERLEEGETIERNLDKISQERDEYITKYRELIQDPEDRASFDNAYDTVRSIYTYAEDHLFWVEHWLHTIWFEKIRGFGGLLKKYGMLESEDDIFMFNRYEIPEMITELVTAWALGEGVPVRKEYYKDKVHRRRTLLDAAAEWTPPPALGVPPKEIAEPFTIMLWGVTSETVNEWLKGMSADTSGEINELKGFAASAGVVEGPARILKRIDDITTLQPGEIAVCTSINPSWASVFTKIEGAVTDIGGLTSHAAIVAREYSLPAVTGTGVATSVLHTGDIIKIDGGAGIVNIIRRSS